MEGVTTQQKPTSTNVSKELSLPKIYKVCPRDHKPTIAMDPRTYGAPMVSSSRQISVFNHVNRPFQQYIIAWFGVAILQEVESSPYLLFLPIVTYAHKWINHQLLCLVLMPTLVEQRGHDWAQVLSGLWRPQVMRLWRQDNNTIDKMQ